MCVIFRSSRERTSWNFCARLFPFFVIWPNYGACVISCDSMTASFLACSRTLLNSLALQGAHQLQFSHATASNTCHFVQLGYLCDFARSREGHFVIWRNWEPMRFRDGKSFSACPICPIHPEAHWLEFSRAITSYL